MNLLFNAMLALAAAGVLSALLAKLPRAANVVGACGVAFGAVLGLVPVIRHLRDGASQEILFERAWSLPLGTFSVGLDFLSAWFLLAILAVCALAAIYGMGYLRPFAGRKNLGAVWFFYAILTAAMMLVVLARDALLFLLAWEVMSLASYFLVVFEDEQESVREAGWTYLVATHIGTAFLLILFVLMGQTNGATSFGAMARAGVPEAVRGAAFLMAVIGFGTKAGFIPLHVWLPEAHPAAPSHVSAVMSGVMIKTGIYGLLRTLAILGAPEAWWGWTLLAIGVTSGVLGVVFALAQHDLKRLLAYHSVENIGIIAIGIGVGLLGIRYGHPLLGFLGFAGALLHVFNHAIFKGLLFMGAGAVRHATGTLEIERLGGLLKQMPCTGVTFVIAAAAISGLPPLNGFISEFLIYAAAFKASLTPGVHGLLFGVATIGAMALIGGLAAACFAKAFGIVFLGEPRAPEAQHAHECPWSMRLPMMLMAVICVAVGCGGWIAAAAVTPVASQMVAAPLPETAGVDMMMRDLSVAMACVLVLILAAVALRKTFLAGRSVERAGTWDCGYVAPTARMQYTASSFAQPLLSLFQPVLRTKRSFEAPEGLLPGTSHLHTHTPDVFKHGLLARVFEAVRWAFGRLRWMQHGRIHLYVLYIALTLLVLLIWKLS